MWKKSFVATTVALGGSVDDALQAFDACEHAEAELAELVEKLRAQQRGPRAAALATAVHAIVLAVDGTTLR